MPSIENKKPGVSAYSLPPRMDALNCASIGRVLAERVRGTGQTLYLDAGKLEYISSQGVRTLRRLRRELFSRQGALFLVAPRGFAHEVLILGGLGDALMPAEGKRPREDTACAICP